MWGQSSIKMRRLRPPWPLPCRQATEPVSTVVGPVILSETVLRGAVRFRHHHPGPLFHCSEYVRNAGEADIMLVSAVLSTMHMAGPCWEMGSAA